MTAEQLGIVAGVILSLALAYIPKLKDWYDTQTSQAKVQIMGGLLVAAALGVYGLGCANLWVYVPCTVDGAKQLVDILVKALMANQATYFVFVRQYK